LGINPLFSIIGRSLLRRPLDAVGKRLVGR
jgi:hypothetical protein